MDDELILGLGIYPVLVATSAKLEANEGVAGAQGLEQNFELTNTSSPINMEVMHTNPRSSNLSLGLDIYDNNNSSEYRLSP
jgi:hypothetical protein